jgi:hypothetical protein
MKLALKFFLTFVLAFIIGWFAKFIYFSILTGVNPIIAILMLSILIAIFIFELIFLIKKDSTRKTTFFVILINFMSIAICIYLEIEKIKTHRKQEKYIFEIRE